MCCIYSSLHLLTFHVVHHALKRLLHSTSIIGITSWHDLSVYWNVSPHSWFINQPRRKITLGAPARYRAKCRILHGVVPNPSTPARPILIAEPMKTVFVRSFCHAMMHLQAYLDESWMPVGARVAWSISSSLSSKIRLEGESCNNKPHSDIPLWMLNARLCWSCLIHIVVTVVQDTIRGRVMQWETSYRHDHISVVEREG